MVEKYEEEPVFIDVQRSYPYGKEADNLKDAIGTLCKSQTFAVLATQGKGITKTSLISFAVSSDLKNIVFATPVNTEKFELITKEENVSILVDNRCLHQDRINEISAVTVLGKGRILSDENEILKWSELLIEKHSNLKNFVKAPTTSVIIVDVVCYLHVKQFQEVKQWDPN